MREPGCGPADRLREAADELILQDAFHLRKPVLGICYGMQSLVVWKGGSLIQDLPTEPVKHSGEHGTASEHPVRVEVDGRLARMMDGPGLPLDVWTNSSHHQAVAAPGSELVIVARSHPDGVIEAVEGVAHQFVLGVQWHPERMREANLSRAIFRAFIASAQPARDAGVAKGL
jgi:putative glutamine amidotransferase